MRKCLLPVLVTALVVAGLPPAACAQWPVRDDLPQPYRDGSVTAFIEDMEPLAVEHAGAQGVGVDADGNVYGGVVRRQMLERHVRE